MCASAHREDHWSSVRKSFPVVVLLSSRLIIKLMKTFKVFEHVFIIKNTF